jgi:hypothetical protein
MGNDPDPVSESLHGLFIGGIAMPGRNNDVVRLNKSDHFLLQTSGAKVIILSHLSHTQANH